MPGLPNILYLHSHDTGRYVQPYGHAVPTPNIQGLAEQGILFRNAFCAAPTCSPSRAALLTGMSPHSCGMLGLAHRGFQLNDYRQHIVHTLRREGYYSALCGVQHVASDPNVIGYDEIINCESRSAAHVAPAAANWLTSRPKRPFFLSVGFTETHREFPAPGATEDPRYTLPPAPLPDTPQTRRDMAAFKASARNLDFGIGIVLNSLKAHGSDQDTLVICTTDHGIAFPGMKCNLTDHGLGVMLIMRGPGFSGGSVIDAMVSQIDLFPTICDYLHIEPPEWLQGASMIPLVRGKVQDINDAVFGEVTFHAAYEPQRALRTNRWKYIRHFDQRRRPVLPNCDDGPSKEVWMRHGWKDRPTASERLYDLLFDPGETNNLAGDLSARSVLTEMRTTLDRWMHETEDPLLVGPVKPPSGARMNDADGLSPKETPIIYD